MLIRVSQRAAATRCLHSKQEAGVKPRGVKKKTHAPIVFQTPVQLHPSACPAIVRLDDDDPRVCALGKNMGTHVCTHDTAAVDPSDWRWCGSNFDALGNARFAGSDGQVRVFKQQAKALSNSWNHERMHQTGGHAPTCIVILCNALCILGANTQTDLSRQGIPYFDGEKMSSRKLNGLATQNEDLNWGLTNFDNFFNAVVTIFQIITLEGWTSIM